MSNGDESAPVDEMQEYMRLNPLKTTRQDAIDLAGVGSPPVEGRIVGPFVNELAEDIKKTELLIDKYLNKLCGYYNVNIELRITPVVEMTHSYKSKLIITDLNRG